MPKLAVPVGPEDHVIGPSDAKIILLEYGDFECPFCGRAFPILKAVVGLLRDHVKFAYRHFPLSEIHPHAEQAAEASEAAGAQGKFWLMHDMLFANQDRLDTESLISYANALKLDLAEFTLALKEGVYKPRVRRDFISGIYSGVNGTPTLFINDSRYDGPIEPNDLIHALNLELREALAR